MTPLSKITKMTTPLLQTANKYSKMLIATTPNNYKVKQLEVLNHNPLWIKRNKSCLQEIRLRKRLSQRCF